jgi:hypothetical protein
VLEFRWAEFFEELRSIPEDERDFIPNRLLIEAEREDLFWTFLLDTDIVSESFKTTNL